MDIRICTTSPGGTVNVQGNGFGRTFGHGAEVDFDETIAPGVTWRSAIGDRYAHLFPRPDAPAPVARRRTPITTHTAEEAE